MVPAAAEPFTNTRLPLRGTPHRPANAERIICPTFCDKLFLTGGVLTPDSQGNMGGACGAYRSENSVLNHVKNFINTGLFLFNYCLL